jgi:hypothetical protein
VCIGWGLEGTLLAAADGRGSVKIEQILPDKADAWLDAMRVFVARLESTTAGDPGLV